METKETTDKGILEFLLRDTVSDEEERMKIMEAHRSAFDDFLALLH